MTAHEQQLQGTRIRKGVEEMSVLEKEKINVSGNSQPTDELVWEVEANVDENGTPGRSRLLITRSRLEVVSEEGELVREYPLSSVKEARMLSAVGGGTLVIDTEEGAVVLARFTAELNRQMSFATKTIQALIQGEELPVLTSKDMPRLCPTCQERLPEGSNLCPTCSDKGKVISRLLSYAKPYKMRMITAALMMMAATLMELIPPYLTKVIVDDVLQPKHIGHALLWLVIALAATRVVLSLMQTLRGYIGVWIGGKLMGDIRKDTYQALMRLSLSFFDRRQTSQFIGRVNSDSEAMRQFLTDGIIWIAGQLLMLIAISA